MLQTRRALIRGIGAAAVLGPLAACGSRGQGSGKWEPNKDVTINVAFPAGGGTDAAARELAAGLEEVRDGINVIVVNRDGGSGTVGYTYSAQQSKNPHELTFVEPSFVTVPATTEVPFATDSFTPIGGVSLYTSVLIAPSGKLADLQALVDAADDARLTVGFPSATGPQAMSVELLQDAIGAEFEHIVYQNGGEIAAGVASGDLDFALTALEHAQGFIDDGRVEALAVLSDDRFDDETYAEVPTAVEAGVDVAFSGFRGLVAGGDLTDDQIAYWISALDDYRASDAYGESLSKTMTQELDESGPDFGTYLDEFNEQAASILPKLGK